MPTTQVPTTLSDSPFVIVAGSAGRFYITQDARVINGPFASRNDAEADLYGDDEDAGVSWYCNHDVPNGCRACSDDRNLNAAIDAMTDAERADYLYDGGTFESYFAPGGPAFLAGL